MSQQPPNPFSREGSGPEDGLGAPGPGPPAPATPGRQAPVRAATGPARRVAPPLDGRAAAPTNGPSPVRPQTLTLRAAHRRPRPGPAIPAQHLRPAHPTAVPTRPRRAARPASTRNRRHRTARPATAPLLALLRIVVRGEFADLSALKSRSHWPTKPFPFRRA